MKVDNNKALERHRRLKKKRRARRLKEAYAKHDQARAENPLPQGQLDLRDPYLSRREWLRQVKHEVFGDPL